MILVREGYVRRLKAVSKRLLAGDRTPFRIAGGSGLIDLLVQTRSASLAVVHGVTLWRDGLAADMGKREKIACENDGEKDTERKQSRIRNAVDDAKRTFYVERDQLYPEDVLRHRFSGGRPSPRKCPWH